MIRSLILLVLISSTLAIAARIRRPIPSPIIHEITKASSPGGNIEIKGIGFINNFPQAHKVFLKQGKKKYRLKVIEASKNSLKVEIPEKLYYGDYNLSLKIQTRFLKSQLNRSNRKLLLRPKAPPRPELNFLAIEEKAEIDEISEETYYKDHTVHTELETDLKIGENLISSYYIEDGFLSLRSNPARFYYLPETAVEPELKVEAEKPIKSFATLREDFSDLDVSDITNTEKHELSRHFYLKTPKHQRYLEHIIQLKPVFIEKIHVTEPEYAILRNRSSLDFPLSDCFLADSLKSRYKFSSEVLPAKESIKIEANLGLNNSSPDSLSLECKDQLIDQVRYEKVDDRGFAI